MPLCGFLISSGFMGGWPSVFYIMGISGIVWFVFWTIFVFDTPAVHPRIEAKELSYIQHSIGSQGSKVRVESLFMEVQMRLQIAAVSISQ
jgi:MFS family permease